jgi:selenide, water dikinase
LPGAVEYARAGAQPGGLRNNREFAGSCVSISRSIAGEMEALLYDPQTSGGLLISIAAVDADSLVRNCPGAFRIGRVLARSQSPIVIV